MCPICVTKGKKRVQAAGAKVNPQMALLFSNVGIVRSADFTNFAHCAVTDNAR